MDLSYQIYSSNPGGPADAGGFASEDGGYPTSRLRVFADALRHPGSIARSPIEEAYQIRKSQNSGGDGQEPSAVVGERDSGFSFAITKGTRGNAKRRPN